jgi:hypothetical protein
VASAVGRVTLLIGAALGIGMAVLLCLSIIVAERCGP